MIEIKSPIECLTVDSVAHNYPTKTVVETVFKTIKSESSLKGDHANTIEVVRSRNAVSLVVKPIASCDIIINALRRLATYKIKIGSSVA